MITFLSRTGKKRFYKSVNKGHEGVGGGASVRGRGSGLPRAESQAEGKSSGLEGGKPGADDPINLERRVGLLSGVALIVGTMIGSGIFVSPKGLLERTGSVGLSLVVWAACGGLSLLGALSYAELGTLVDASGGEYAYFLQGFAPGEKRRLWWGPIPSFLFAWVSLFLLKPSSLAIICLTCSEYFVRIFNAGSSINCLPPDLAIKLFAAFVIILITFINSYSVNLATRVQNVFTAAKLVAILIIVVGGMVKLGQGNTQYLATGFQGSTKSFGDIATAFYSGLWAYDGWNNLNYVTEELKKPYTNLPRAIIIGLPLVTICYLLVNISYLAVMSQDELLASETVAVTFGNRVLGWAAFLMPLAVTLSTFGAANGTAFTSGRLCFVAAREGHMVDVLSYVHAKKLTPSPALLFNAAIALIMVIPSDIGSLIDFFSFTAWIFYGGAMAALIIMRFTMKDAPRPYKVPIAIPVLVLIISVYLVVGPIIDSPKIEYLYASLFIIAGLFFYFPFVYMKKSIPGMGHMTTILQLLLQVVPTDVMPDA
ncbi:b(0,+)-type amino acid transporter 1 isoform X3 [Cherax quadricarinatus]|uniref:b(0,+)-type amino acid transporter 1 isoform X3 n=1 Tax=Cherax quadricarinatus TaxID=27406 RepID=UPI00387E7FEB